MWYFVLKVKNEGNNKQVFNNQDVLLVLVDHFTKNKEGRQKFKETGDSRQIYQNKLDKACFQHVISCGDFKDFPKRTALV